MGFGYISSEGVFSADGAVILTLCFGVAFLGPSDGPVVHISYDILLLDAGPGVLGFDFRVIHYQVSLVSGVSRNRLIVIRSVSVTQHQNVLNFIVVSFMLVSEWVSE